MGRVELANYYESALSSEIKKCKRSGGTRVKSRQDTQEKANMTHSASSIDQNGCSVCCVVEECARKTDSNTDLSCMMRS